MTYYKIHSAPLVYDEMNESVLWYNKQATLLGGHLLKQISNSIGLISQFPHVTYVRYSPQIRCCIISHFPYMIHYQVDADKQAIYIIAILHMRRRGSER
jgi:hypothetical protein